LRARGRSDGDDALVIESAYVLGIAAFWKGELEAARRHFEAAVNGYRPGRRPAHLLRYWLDPQVVSLSRLGNTYWFLGDADAAVRARDRALALAEEIAHEPTRRTALVFAAVLALDMGDTARLREDVAALESGRSDEDTRPTRVSTEVFRAYVRVLDGEVQPGLSSIQSALDEMSEGSHAPGQRAVIARLLIAAYEAADDPRGRLAAAEQALTVGGAASLWEAEAHRARAECLVALGASADQVVAPLECALAIARRQGAVMLERRAEATLARFGLRVDEPSSPIVSR
jgi:tetratricopeptide (TPR) repeat protein